MPLLFLRHMHDTKRARVADTAATHAAMDAIIVQSVGFLNLGLAARPFR